MVDRHKDTYCLRSTTTSVDTGLVFCIPFCGAMSPVTLFVYSCPVSSTSGVTRTSFVSLPSLQGLPTSQVLHRFPWMKDIHFIVMYLNIFEVFFFGDSDFTFSWGDLFRNQICHSVIKSD